MTQLEHARSLARARKWTELARLAAAEPPDGAERSGEHTYLFADALRRIGELDRARPLAVEADRLAVRSADARLSLRTLNLLGMIAFESGAMQEAETRFSELLERASDAGDDEFAARASNNLGILANVRGETELALTAYQRALASYHRIGYTRGLAQTYYNLGISYRDLGFDAEADSHYDRAIQFAEESDSEDVLAFAETERANLRARDGDGQLAESIGTRALARLERMGDRSGAANAIRVLAAAARARGAPDLALERLESALATLESHPDPIVRAEIQRDRGSLLSELGDSAAASAALHEAVTAYEQIGASADADATRLMLSVLVGPGEEV
ncbi:MAG: tetratricopeptide repeat protein [Gemmatimonadota bacterium]